MNHNFLPFDICEMLPKENPYHCAYFINITDKTESHFTGRHKVPDVFNQFTFFKPDRVDSFTVISDIHGTITWVRDVWTINDAVEYLITQGYAVSVEFDTHYRSYWSLKIKHDDSWLNCWFDGEKGVSCKSRIEAYTEGIRHCLNLMKNERTR